MTEFEKRMKSKLESMRVSILSKIKTSTSIPQEERSDIIDLTAVEKLRDVESIVTSIDTDILKLIERALDKIQSGTYGYCEICGIKIDRERLEEVPYVRYCIDCQEKVELEERISRVEEETLASAPVRVSLDDSYADLEEFEEEEEEKPTEAKGEEGEEGEEEKEEEDVESELKDIEISEELDEELEEEIEEEVEKEIGGYEEESEGEEEEQEPVARRKREKKIAKKHDEGKLKVGRKRLAQKQTSKMEKEKKEEKKKEIKSKEKKVKAKALKTKKTEEKGESKAKRKSKK
jgi:RNA polymerase-binding transcription factor DksA